MITTFHLISIKCSKVHIFLIPGSQHPLHHPPIARNTHKNSERIGANSHQTSRNSTFAVLLMISNCEIGPHVHDNRFLDTFARSFCASHSRICYIHSQERELVTFMGWFSCHCTSNCLYI